MRKTFRGVFNVVSFNRHFYILSAAGILFVWAAGEFIGEPFGFYLKVLCLLAVAVILVSLAATFYVYDLSGLYDLFWLNDLKVSEKGKIVNINAGFDETSGVLRQKYPAAELFVFDFYDAAKHTEISIKRARKAYPPFPGTKQISSAKVPLENDFADVIFAVLSAHEIRNADERANFFKELHRILKPAGQIVVTEHLRDTANFLAYNIGFFHFHSKSVWRETFRAAHLNVVREIKITPFISTFILEKL